MKRSLSTLGASTAAVMIVSVAALAQSPSPAQPAAQQPSAPAAARQVTITGCVQSEADYRKANNLGRGGAVGTGVGAGDEFVIVNAANAPAKTTTPAEPAPAGTAGSVASAYEATGSGEGQLKQHAGKRVEITGTVKAAAQTTAGQPTGGADPMARDLKLPELEITSVRAAATGECPMR